MLTLASIRPLAVEAVALADAVDRIAAEDLHALVDSPSVDASLKDGYAVIAYTVADASPDHPARLTLAGHAAAGGRPAVRVEPGTTVRVLTGAGIPAGADAVVSEEFAIRQGRDILITRFAEAGRNILQKGSDVAVGDSVVSTGQVLTPVRLGLLAAAGCSQVKVFGRPTIAIVATGDEVVAPGHPLPEGKLYASNMVTLGAWCRRFGMQTHMAIVRDEDEALFGALQSLAARADAVVTSGGAWTGDRDLVVRVLQRLGWRQIFHRIRMGPGKAVGFGLLAGKPIFILPGGPPSNLIGFLQIALPGLLKLGGRVQPALPTTRVKVGQALSGRNSDWTHFIFGTLDRRHEPPLFTALRQRSRLQEMAEAGALVAVPEGCTCIAAGSVVSAQLLD